MFEYRHKVQYYETDQMSVVHHSNYIRWFEEARTAYLDSLGYSYARMEKEGAISPVLKVEADYKSMTRFGETVVIETEITAFTGIRFEVEYTVKNAETGEIRCTGKTSHCFIDRDGKILRTRNTHPELFELFKGAVKKDEEQK